LYYVSKVQQPAGDVKGRTIADKFHDDSATRALHISIASSIVAAIPAGEWGLNEWHLERLPGDVRREAEGAARQAGVPLHRWLAQIIRDTCVAEGIAPARELTRGLDRAVAINGTPATSARVNDAAAPKPEPPAIKEADAIPVAAAAVNERDATEPAPARRSAPAPEPAPLPTIGITMLPPAAAKEVRSTTLQTLVTGIERRELSPLGEARLCLKLLTEEMASIDDITAATGRSREQVARTLRLLTLSDRVRELIDSGALTRQQAFALLDADDHAPDPTGPGARGRA
jgi:hypothetical protein